MIKLFVSDLDGTLLDRGKRMTPEDRQALQEADRRGVQLCIASGRMASEIKRIMEDIGINCHIIAQNGASVYTASGESVHAHRMEPALVREVLDTASDLGVIVTIGTHTHNHVLRMDERTKELERRMFEPFEVLSDESAPLPAELAVTKLSYFGENEALKRLEERFRQSFAGRIEYCFSDSDCMDVMPPNVSKGVGLAALLQRLGLPASSAVCIGDSFNDVPMFAETPHSFAMAGCQPGVRAAAAHEAYSVAEAVRWALRFNQQ
ncbi:Cof-type HAD-IIB family hydrolase [Paenibacillus cymbidii]|uniref:Cof-type HAD-IIB family hydrolase n=1 Tax=Paenibacillus cymbidii TaxID=1639034 RepID=UPI0010801A22|nr:HAD family hydrolase [Paenibacillus cymbidii]